MKIKRKVEMNLPQLIEWAWDNPKRHEIRAFIDDTREFGSEIYVQEHNGFISIQGEFNKDDTFTVGVEEEITEDTKFKHLIEVATNDSSLVWQHSNINQRIGSQSREFHAYIDGEFKIIWVHDKGLVE